MKKIYSIFMFGTLLLILGLSQRIIAQQTFVHPGIAFNQDDLDQLKVNITQEPWLSGYNSFKNSSQSQLSYAMKGPHATVSRSPDLNNVAWKQDMVAIRNLALMYVFTGDSLYARKATNMLDAWAVTNTVWSGGENQLDIGDYAHCWGVGAEILRYTFPGWTAANTQHVENYFANVLFPTSYVPGVLRDQNKGAIQLKTALAASIFCNNRTRFNQSIEVYRMDAGGGMRNSLPNGETGDTGRDDHWQVQAESLVWFAEVAWKQKVDMFSELDNRVLAIAELYHQYAFDGAAMTYVPFGGYASYWTNWGIQPGKRPWGMTNIIHNAYNRRKGIPTPHTDRMRAALMQPGTNSYFPAGGDFLYLKSSDTSTAVPLPPVYYPADHVQPVSNLTHIDIGNTGLAGSSSFNNGVWTLKAAGTSRSNAFSFNFKKVSGDAGLVVKVDSVSPLSGGCGVMLRESLAPGARYWEIFLGANGGAGRHWQPKAPWWLKIERVNTRIFTYHSQDGIHWTNLNCSYSATGFPTELYAGFFTMSGNTSVLNTATFSNVGYSQTAPTGSPEISSATTATTTIGVPFTYSINASANPSTYSVSGLPAGLSLDAATGIISGTPTELGQSEVTLTATNTSGSGTATLILKVLNNQAPAAIASAVASVINTTQIRLSWPASANATSYSIKRSLTAGGPYTTIQAGINLTSFTDPSPAYEVNNYYVITALTGDMESANSNEVYAAIPPAIPGRPVATNQSDRIDLAWDAANGASSYKVKRGTASGGPYTTIATIGTNSYTDTNVSSVSPYYYVLSSVGVTLESANSPEAFGSPGANSAAWSPTPLSDSFNLAANWTGNALPVNPAILTFDSTTDSLLTNDITDLEASRIQFASDADSYTISGNGLTLKNDLVNNSLKTQTFTTPLQLTDQLSVNNAGSVVLNGPISGTGSLKMKSGSLYINGNTSTYSGNTTIAGGGITASGIGTGTPSNPTAGPFGTGKILLNGGQLRSASSANVELKLYNDIEVLPGNRSTFYEDSRAISLYGKLLGSGSVANDARTTAGLYLYGDNSGFTGTFTSFFKNQLVNFVVPESGSANANWLLDANGVDNHRLSFKTGTIHFGSLSGRGYFRCAKDNSPVISIGALNTTTSFGGTFDGLGGNLSVEKVGTGSWGVWGNHAYGGTTTVKKGKFFLSNNPTAGVFYSPVIVLEGAFGGTGKSTASATIGTGSGPGAVLEPGNDGIGTLTISDLTLKADATYTAELNLGTAVGDKVTATNVTLLNSPKLTLIPIAGELPSGTSYTIVNNTGTSDINGTFKDLPELALISAGAYNFRITYKGGSGNDVALLDDRTVPLTINSALIDTALFGRDFSYTITAIKSPTSFNATGLPAGLTVNTTTGVISGVPTEKGLFPVTLTASNATQTHTATLSLRVLNTTVENVLVASGDAKNILEWDPILDFSYNIKRAATAGGPYTTIANVSTTKFTDTNVSNGTIYYYVVASIDSISENPNSTEVVARPNVGQFTYLKFDEASGTRGIDSWGANHGTLKATASRSVGRDGQALKLDGTTNAYATLPTGIVSSLTDFTISTWINVEEKSNFMRVFDFGTGTSKFLYLTIQAGAADVMRYGIKNGGTAQEVAYNYTLPLNTWTHFAITQLGNTCSMYINGALVATNTGITIKPSTLGSTNQNYLGKSQWSSDPLFKGSIDEFKIYSRALNASEIAAAYTSQTITLNAIAPKLMGDEDFDPAATASSGLPVTYTSSDTTVASIVNGKVRILATGTSTITASQAGNNTYWPASQTKVISVAITNDTQLGAIMNRPFTYTISNKPLSNFTATGLPAGLSLNADTGVISGTPTAYGTSSVVLTASNGSSTGTQTITLTVQDIVVSNVIVAAGDAKNILEWDPIQNFTYNIKRSTTSGGPYTTIGTVSTTKFTDTNISNGNTYYYVVSSIDNVSENPNSTEVVARPNIGQVSYLKFNESTGTRAIDSWGARHGTLTGGNSSTNGLEGKAVQLNGSSGYVALPSGVMTSINDFTIAGWVNLNSPSPYQRIFDFGTGQNSFMALLPVSGSNTVRYTIKVNGGTEQQINSTSPLPTGEWHHVAVTLSGTVGTLYIDGVSAGTNSNMTNKPSALGTTTLNYIGKSQFNDPYLNATVDEFRIYNRALSGLEVKTVYSQYAPPLAPKNLVVTNSNSAPDLNWTASTGATTYSVKRAGTLAGPYTTIATVNLPSYTDTDPSAANCAVYFYKVSASNSNGESANSSMATLVSKKLTGTVIGTSGSFGSNTATTITAAVDGSLSTFFDAPTANGGWVGYDLGEDNTQAVFKIRYAPRSSYPSRMTGGVFQGSNVASFSTATTLFIIPTAPVAGVYTEQTIKSPAPFRYIRYLAPNNGYGNVAEVEFYGIPSAAAPQITSEAGTKNLSFGAAFSYTIPATNANNFSASDLPIGLSLNACTGLISGTLSAVGTFPVILTASNTLGSAKDTMLLIIKKDQTIAFNALPQKTLGDADFDAAATASSGLAVAYESSDSTVATIVDGKVHLVGAGTTTITALQDGDTEYNPANSVTQTLSVNRKEQSITFAALEPKTLGDADFDPAATASSGLAVAYESSDSTVAMIVDGIVHLVGAGTTTITASQAGSEEFNAATASQVLTVVKKEQSISFAPIAEKTTRDADFDPAAVASSSLAVSYTSSNENVATIVDGMVHLVGGGTTVITALQAGNESYNAASSVTQELHVFVPPAVFAKNIEVELNASGTASITAAQVDNSSISYSGALNLILDQTTFGCSNVGTPVTVTLTGTDAKGYSSSATAQVTVVDHQKPVLTAPSAQSFCFAGSTYTLPSLVATDNCGVASIAYTVSGATQRSGSGADASGVFNAGTSTVTFNVTDVHGNTELATTSVSINTLLSSAIPDVYAMNSSTDEKNTIYLGYGPTSLSITATPAGGTAPYTYLWSTNQTAQAISVSAAGTYTVIVTDAKGCQTTTSIVIKTINVQCGNSNDKVMVCHNGHEICVSSNAVQSHLDHGDKLGSCTTSARMESKDISKVLISEENTVKGVTVYPNPVTSVLNIKVSEVHSGATLELYNALGMKVQSQALNSTLEVMSFDRLPSGIYFLNITNGNEITVKKIIKE